VAWLLSVEGEGATIYTSLEEGIQERDGWKTGKMY
jgi:hypothetical protein